MGKASENRMGNFQGQHLCRLFDTMMIKTFF